MKEINIRFKTASELKQSYDLFPYVITIDGVAQENIKRFYIDLDLDNCNIENNTYTIEKFTRYPTEFLKK